MTAHKHAALMAQYAQDALETETPWTRWQVRRRDAGGQWVDCSIPIGWGVETEYRRKPRTMTYTVTIPEPMRDAPEVGEKYYVADPKTRGFYGWPYWHGDEIDFAWLERGLCFATKEDAIAAAKAMIPIKGE